MARVKLSPLLAELKGSIHNITFQKSIGGDIARLKPFLKQFRSESQQLNQSRLSYLINQWHGLTNAQRSQWNQFAIYSRHKYRKNSALILNGYYLFLKYNLLRLIAGLSVFTAPHFWSPEMIELDVEITASPGNFFVAYGEGGNTLAWSNDGINWTGLGEYILDLVAYDGCWNNTLFAGVGEGTNSLAYSYDGKTWYGLGSSIFTLCGYDVCWNGSLFVATGQGGNTLAHSSSGTSWTGQGTSIFSTVGRGVCWNGSKFVAVGMGGNSIAHSSSGTSWTGLGTSIFSSSGWSVCWNGTLFVATGYGTNTLAYSYDGINWTGLGTSIFSATGHGVAWNGSLFVATGIGTNTLAYSYDGINWTGLGTSIFLGAGYNVSWNGSLFVATGAGGNTLAYSSNGINWTGLGTSIFSSTGYGVCSINAPCIYPPVFPSLKFDFGADLIGYGQAAVLKLSRPYNNPVCFQTNKCRVIQFDYTQPSPYQINDLYQTLFGVHPEPGLYLMTEFQIFADDNARVFPRFHYVLEVQTL